MPLLPGEEITLPLLTLQSLVLGDEEINAKYIKGEVRIVTEQARYPLTSIVPMIESGDYKMNPEFQRRHRWSRLQKSKLIESFIMNVPIPPVFLYEDSYSHYEVMDGLQRLTAIYDFYKNRFVLEGLEQWPELNGKSCDELPTQIKKGIDRRYLSSIILLQETAKNTFEAQKLKQLVFERINSGGVKLEPQESRNAIYNGPFNDLCIELARNTYLCKTWDIPETTFENAQSKKINSELLANPLFKKMGDVELVLRFFANRQRTSIGRYTNNYKGLLDTYLRYSNDKSPQVLEQMKTLFEDTIKFVYTLFEENAFNLFRVRNGNWKWFMRPTTVIYDALMVIASEFLDHKDAIIAKKPYIKTQIEQFYKDNYETFEGRNTNPSIIVERESKFREFFQNLV